RPHAVEALLARRWMADRTSAQPSSGRRGEVGRAAHARRRHMTGEPISAEHTTALQHYLDAAFGERVATAVTPMAGGGSCEVLAADRGPKQWALRRAPRHASSATAHNVLREFRILDAIKDEPVPIARPAVACDDPEVFGAPFYVMERIDGRPILQAVP